MKEFACEAWRGWVPEVGIGAAEEISCIPRNWPHFAGILKLTVALHEFHHVVQELGLTVEVGDNAIFVAPNVRWVYHEFIFQNFAPCGGAIGNCALGVVPS